MRQIHIFFKISNARQCLFPHFVRFVNWILNVKLFLFWFSRWYNTGVISGSQMGSQLLQNTKIIKQTVVLLWKIWRKYGSVSYLFSCTKQRYSNFDSIEEILSALHHRTYFLLLNILILYFEFISVINFSSIHILICEALNSEINTSKS